MSDAFIAHPIELTRTGAEVSIVPKATNENVQFDERTGEVRIIFRGEEILIPETYKTKRKAIHAGEKYLSRLEKKQKKD